MRKKVNVFWFRRDLRIKDNHAFYKALKSGVPVLPVFIFDTKILDKLYRDDTRVTFIYHQIIKLKSEFEKSGGSIKVFYTSAEEAFKALLTEYELTTVFVNKDYEPDSIQRDQSIEKLLIENGIKLVREKDQVIFEEHEIVKDDGKAYTVFTPFSKKWKLKLAQKSISEFPSENELRHILKTEPFYLPKLADLEFQKSNLVFPLNEIKEEIIQNYSKLRDFPAVNGTTKLGIHLRFGTISIRELVSFVSGLSEIFLNELIWREFFMQILWHFPHVENRAFKPKYDFIEWRNDEDEFKLWCKGKTGFPMVDAGMQELNQTGFMHNRVRMVTAGFLTKHLLTDWRWGEAYFAEKLLDFELASNNGNWQWAAGSGCDAAPYFRIFNPETQLKKFDPDLNYVKKWIPEFGTTNYTQPIVDHKIARERALNTYKKALR